MNDYAKALGDEKEKEERIKHIYDNHVNRLNKYVEKIREETGLCNKIPYFDPLDGGKDANCLFLLEAPGPRAVISGFISRNNPDETAKNTFELLNEIRIPRNKTVFWNIVPWYIGDEKKIRAIKNNDINEGIVYFHKVLKLLPKLKVIVLVGKKPQKIRKVIQKEYPSIIIVKSNHPSPMFINREKGNRVIIKKQWEEIKKYI